MCRGRLLCQAGVLVWSQGGLFAECSAVCLRWLFAWLRLGSLSHLCLAWRTVQVCAAFLLRICIASGSNYRAGQAGRDAASLLFTQRVEMDRARIFNAAHSTSRSPGLDTAHTMH